MSEKRFVEHLQRSAKQLDPSAFVWKTNDRFSLGIPDLVIVINGDMYAIEAKYTEVKGTTHDSWSTSLVLKHPFTGPQISVMRQLVKAGAYSFGVIQVEQSEAYIVHPDNIPEGGNFTHRDLEDEAIKVCKRNHIWRITEWPNLLCILSKTKKPTAP